MDACNLLRDEIDHQAAIAQDRFTQIASLESRLSACEAENKELVEALELAINDLEGYEDGAPDASPISKHINALLAEIRPALRDHATKQGKGEA